MGAGFIFSRYGRIAIFRRVLFAYCPVRTLGRSGNLLIACGCSVEVVLFSRPSQTQVVQFRVVCGWMISEALAGRLLCLIGGGLGVTSVCYVSRDCRFVVGRVEIV